ncbi:MAG: beta-lactamase family protein, partial [Ruminococcus sp.]|nr:beta-lactamase family protein [Ruminococcus sp.]
MKAKKTISILLSVLMLLAPMFSLSVQAAEIGDSVAPVSSMKAYQDFLDELMIEYNISGVAYVTHNGRVLCQSARGMQNTAENKPMTIDTLFPIGSNSKQFCAASILLLQEQGKLSVDDKLSKYFPEYTIGKDVTIKNLLTMRSGIRDHVNEDTQYKGHEIPTNEYPLSNTATEQENQEAILNWLFTQELKFAPDKMFSYSNTNYLLLSLIVEKVSGMSYSDFVKQNIFTPLGMTNSGFYEELVDSPNIAENNELEEYQDYIDPYMKGLSQGAGDIATNAKDMDKWMTALSKGTLLSEKSFKEMTTPNNGYGYGVVVDPEL